MCGSKEARNGSEPGSVLGSYTLMDGIRIQVDPSGSKHGSKLICFAGYHFANSMVSGSKWIHVDPSTDPSSYALLATTSPTRWYQGPSGSKWIQARIQAHMLCWLPLRQLDGIRIQVDPSGSKHGSKLICFAGYHFANSMVSGSKWIQVDPSTDPSSYACLLYTSPSPRDGLLSRMPSSA